MLNPTEQPPQQPTETELLAEVVDLLADIHTWVRWMFWIFCVPAIFGLVAIIIGALATVAGASS